MSRYSYFQYLPAVIIQRVVYYTDHVGLNDKLMLTDRVDMEKKVRINIFALSHTCRAWRTIILGLMYHRCELYTDSDYYVISSNKATMHSEFFNNAPYPKGIAHVRDLHIVANVVEIASGAALAFLQSTNMGELYFPSVTKLNVTMNSSVLSLSGCMQTTEIFEAFIKYICRIVPNPVYIDIHASTKCLIPTQEAYYCLVSHLTRCLRTKGQKISWKLTPDYFIPSSVVHLVPNTLTTLYCFVKETSADIFRLIRMNSQTLESLKLLPIGNCTLTQLIMDDKGKSTRYPYMHNLHVINIGVETFENRASFPGIAPFPRLHSMRMSSQYPFGDDVLFRDNASTLKALQCEFDYETVEMLNTLISKKELKQPCLEDLDIYLFSRDITHGEQFAREYSSFIRKMGTGVKRLCVRDTDTCKLVMDRLISTKNDKWGGCIRDLTLLNTDLKFQQVLDLIKALPNIERLTSGLENDEQLLESLEDTSFLDQIHEKHYPTPPKFRIWEVNSGEVDNAEFGAIYSMLLALACPVFHGIRLSTTCMVEYRETLKILTALYPYKKYPWLSKRLLPSLNWRRTAAR